MALESLRITDYSDREFLLVVLDHQGDDGWTESLDVAKALGFENRRFAAQRFAWLFRYGAVEREHERDESGNLRWHKSGKPMHTQRWRLTELGEQVALGKLRKGDETALGKLTDAQLPLVTRWLSERSRGDLGMAKLVQREWKYGHARRNGYGG
jgi:hypothetical protein